MLGKESWHFGVKPVQDILDALANWRRWIVGECAVPQLPRKQRYVVTKMGRSTYGLRCISNLRITQVLSNKHV